MKLSEIQAGVANNGGTVFNIKSVKTGKAMKVIGKGLGGKFIVKMLSGDKAGQLVEVEDSDRYVLVAGALEANTARKKELGDRLTALQLEADALTTQLEAKETEMNDLEDELTKIVG